MFDRYQGGEQAILVHVFFSKENDTEDLNEFNQLVTSAQIEVLGLVTTTRKVPQIKYFIGEGKAEKLSELVKETEATVVLVNHELTPSQERNLESICQCKVIDRTGLILDIFAQRARTHEGKLQVELAQLHYLSTRLVRGWTHLERQKGGIGLRGPGETQLETDRRLIKKRIKLILSRLQKVEKQRTLNRQARDKASLLTLSLVGYTNAGKSTLFNLLTNADVYAADQLFATLDPTLRRVSIDDVGEIVMADTVGFIRHLPHDLVAAFKATLLEVKQANLLLQVIDASDPNYLDNLNAVNDVLHQIDADEIPILYIMNKIDLLDEREPAIDRDQNGMPIRVWISAESNIGLEFFHQALKERLIDEMVEYELHIPPYLSKLRSMLYNLNAVQNESISEQNDYILQIRLSKIDWLRLKKQHPDLNYMLQTK